MPTFKIYDSTSGTWKYIGAAQELGDLSNVNLSSPSDGQVLTYNGTTGKWINGAGGGGSSTLSGLTDTSISAPSTGQVLTYEGTTGKWINGTLPAGNLPSISSHEFEYLTNNGSTVSWGENPAAFLTTEYTSNSGVITGQNQTLTIDFINTQPDYYRRHAYIAKCLTSDNALNIDISLYYGYDHYIYIQNVSSNTLTITIDNIDMQNDSLNPEDIFLPDSSCTVDANCVAEIGVIVLPYSYYTGSYPVPYRAFVTWRTDLIGLTH